MHIERKYPVPAGNEWVEVVCAINQLIRTARMALAEGVKTHRGVYFPLLEDQLDSLCKDDNGQVRSLAEIIKILPDEI